MLINPEIIKQLKRGSEAAFEALYDLFSAKIFSVAMRLGASTEDAEEVVQEVFLKLWTNRANINEELSINAYLLTITKNTVINRHKKQAYETAYKKYLEKQDLHSFMGTEEQVHYSDFEQLAQNFIQKLPTQQKEIFVLAKKQNLSSKEIAEKLNLSVRTVENQVYRATKKIKTEFKKNGMIMGT